MPPESDLTAPTLSPDGRHRWQDGAWVPVDAPRDQHPGRRAVFLLGAAAALAAMLVAAAAVVLLRGGLPGQNQTMRGTITIRALGNADPNCSVFPVRLSIADGSGKVLTLFRAKTTSTVDPGDPKLHNCTATLDTSVPTGDVYKFSLSGSDVPVTVNRADIKSGKVPRLDFTDPRLIEALTGQ